MKTLFESWSLATMQASHTVCITMQTSAICIIFRRCLIHCNYHLTSRVELHRTNLPSEEIKILFTRDTRSAQRNSVMSRDTKKIYDIRKIFFSFSWKIRISCNRVNMTCRYQEPSSVCQQFVVPPFCHPLATMFANVFVKHSSLKCLPLYARALANTMYHVHKIFL